TTTATTPIDTPSLHDALPISSAGGNHPESSIKAPLQTLCSGKSVLRTVLNTFHGMYPLCVWKGQIAGSVEKGGVEQMAPVGGNRSEEHTSELQSRFDLVCRLL